MNIFTPHSPPFAMTDELFVIQLDTVWVGLWGNESFRIHSRWRI